ncbi:glycosyltransferase family 39 protein [candidate division KSB1 bacterium]|nr:glycosyltransferase family 39 protein [candidate division KSB1 bacterium]
MMRKLNFELPIILLTLLLFYLFFSRDIIQTFSENARMVEANNVDEALHLDIVKNSIEDPNYTIVFSNYGHLYFNLSIILLKLISLFTFISEKTIILTLRIIPLCFEYLTAALLFIFIRKHINQISAYIAIIIIAIYTFIAHDYAIISHPDMLQMFFITGSLIALYKFYIRHSIKWLILAGCLSGLAFACKYSGIFIFILVPILVMIQLNKKENVHSLLISDCYGTWSHILTIVFFIVFSLLASPKIIARLITTDGVIDNPTMLRMLETLRFVSLGCVVIFILIYIIKWKFQQTRIIHTLWVNFYHLLITSYLFLISFVIAFFITSPASFIGFNFISGILYESHHTASGHVFQESSTLITWIGFLFSKPFFGIFLTTILFSRLAFIIYYFIRYRKNIMSVPETLFWGWTVLYIGFLAVRINMARMRYLLPVIPSIIVITAITWSQIFFWLNHQTKLIYKILLMIFCVITIADVSYSTHSLFEFQNYLLGKAVRNPSIMAGEWIKENISPEQQILADHFTYIPPEYLNVNFHYYATNDSLKLTDPDVVLTNFRIRYAFADSNAVDTYVHGSELFTKRFNYYRGLDHGESGYHLVSDFKEVKIYMKSDIL